MDRKGLDELARQIHETIKARMREAREERARVPLCHLVYHPHLGRGGFVMRCPHCGWSPS
jgi:hypothetical protein